MSSTGGVSQIIQELRRRLYAGDQQVVVGTGDRDGEQVAAGDLPAS